MRLQCDIVSERDAYHLYCVSPAIMVGTSVIDHIIAMLCGGEVKIFAADCNGNQLAEENLFFRRGVSNIEKAVYDFSVLSRLN